MKNIRNVPIGQAVTNSEGWRFIDDPTGGHNCYSVYSLFQERGYLPGNARVHNQTHDKQDILP